MFVLISGYFLINAKFKSARVFRTLVETIFYTGIITLILYFTTDRVKVVDLLKSFYPFHLQYWFVTQYLALMLLQPFISRLISTLTKRQYEVLLIVILSLCSVFVKYGFPLGVHYCTEWTVWWFVCLFLVGGYIRLYGDQLPKLKWGLLFLAFWVFNTIAYNFFPFIISTKQSVHYLAADVCFFMWVKGFKIDLTGKFAKGVNYISPSVFAIYLIHEHFVLQPFMLEKFRLWGLLSENLFISTINHILIATGIIIISLVIDKLRICLFKVSRFDNLMNFIQRKVDSVIFQYAGKQ